MYAQLEEGYRVLFYIPLFLALYLLGTSDDRVALFKAAHVAKQYYIKVSFKKPTQEPEGFIIKILVCVILFARHTHIMSSICKLSNLNVMSVLPPVGTYCNRTWDGWLCWGDSAPGTVMQMCPEYFHDFDPAGEVLTRMHKRINTDTYAV